MAVHCTRYQAFVTLETIVLKRFCILILFVRHDNVNRICAHRIMYTYAGRT